MATLKTAREYIIELIPCTCSDEYKSRALTAPDCSQCNYDEDLEDRFKAYAKQIAEKVREDCAENATVECVDWDQHIVDKQSILDTEIILP